MLLCSFLLTRSIVRPLADAIAVAQRIAGNDLTQELRIKERDEPGQLLASLKHMQDSLRQTLQHIAQSSDQLASAAEELHAVTEDTNRGLHQQSAEIEQAATAVNEMTAAVEEVASNAVNTAQASEDADSTTRQGREKVEQALGSLQQLVGDVSTTSGQIAELAHRANEINRVLEVIGEIAEQTNLLALNAAIEAARAGEAGRGFAVVADEVRALAHRTQQSTGEIEQMISGIRSGTAHAVDAMRASESRANSTLEIAQAAGHALTVISQSMSTINDRNLVIASASEQQAQVAREVDRNRSISVTCRCRPPRAQTRPARPARRCPNLQSNSTAWWRTSRSDHGRVCDDERHSITGICLVVVKARALEGVHRIRVRRGHPEAQLLRQKRLVTEQEWIQMVKTANLLLARATS